MPWERKSDMPLIRIGRICACTTNTSMLRQVEAAGKPSNGMDGAGGPGIVVRLCARGRGQRADSTTADELKR